MGGESGIFSTPDTFGTRLGTPTFLGTPSWGHPPPTWGHPPREHPPRGHPPRGHPPRGHPPRGHPPRGHLGDTHLGDTHYWTGLGTPTLDAWGHPLSGARGVAKEQAEQAAQRRSSDTCRAAWAPKVYWRPAIGQPNACLISDESASPVVLRIPRLSRRCAECGSF